MADKLGGALLAPALFFVDLGWLYEPAGAVAAGALGILLLGGLLLASSGDKRAAS